MVNHVERQPSGWAIGFTAFAGLMLLLVGLYHIIAGLAAIVHNEFYVATANYVFQFNVTSWGIIHLIAGVIVFFAGIGVFSGAMWARLVGVIVALLSGIANFMFLPYYPLWSILIIAVDVAVIWALTAHGPE